jgi:hypothetical protein
VRAFAGSRPLEDNAPSTDRQAWRPQPFGTKNVHGVVDPLIEPLWEGMRVLVDVAAADPGHGGIAGRSAVAMARDMDGDDVGGVVEGIDLVLSELGRSVRAEHATIDGYLTHMVVRGSAGAFAGGIEAPSSSEMATQMLMGRRARRSELVESMPEEVSAEEPLGFVAVDLLSVDDDLLLDVPLLERKRVLESVVAEGELVRIGLFVRPPVDPWIGSWRSLGFHSLAYKSANSRYRPGRPNDAWAIARIPKR